MEFRVIGCDGSYPSANGATSGYLVDCGPAGYVLLDCGSGVLSRLLNIMDPADLQAVVITHWHNDHACDMLVLRYYLQICGRRLKVYGPSTQQALRALCACDEFELLDIRDGFDIGGISMSALPVQHPVPAFAVRIEYQEKCLVYTGDIASWTQNTAAFCRGAELLVCDATFAKAQWQENMPHLSAEQAAALASEAGAKKLMLTHCPPNNDWQTLLKEGQVMYPDAQFAAPGMRLSL